MNFRKFFTNALIFYYSMVLSAIIASHLIRRLWPVQCRCCQGRNGRGAYRCWRCGLPLGRAQ